jgi:patatin-like phospholipase
MRFQIRGCFVALIGILAVFNTSCGMIPLYSYSNQGLPCPACLQDQKKTPRVDPYDWTDDQLAKSLFIGVSISGGGSRAANFGAGVLEALNTIGLLDHVTAISGVSGGALPATYYALFGKDSFRKTGGMRDAMKQDFFSPFARRFFYPHNLLRYWVTDFDRSDIMGGVFDDLLFDKTTFSSLGIDGPKLLINATRIPVGVGEKEGEGYRYIRNQQFSFTTEYFENLGSRIDTYPLSSAVMASGAFPGVFHNVTLRDFNRPWRITPESLEDPKGFMEVILTNSDPLTIFIRNFFRDELPELFASSQHLNDEEEIRDAMMYLLIALRGENLAGPAAKAGLDVEKIREEAKHIPALGRKLSPDSDLRMMENRLLLQDGYSAFFKTAHPRYRHHFDGGPVDNLGITPLMKLVENYAKAKIRWDWEKEVKEWSEQDKEKVGVPPLRAPSFACLLIMVDAYPDPTRPETALLSDTRGTVDYFIDHNVIDATDTLLSQSRESIIGAEQMLGRKIEIGGEKRAKGIDCELWHIHFDHLAEIKGNSDLKAAISRIATHYRLEGPPKCTDDNLQELLYEAAAVLVLDDHGARNDLKSLLYPYWTPPHLPEERKRAPVKSMLKRRKRDFGKNGDELYTVECADKAKEPNADYF